jgi:hypothetical protein
MKKHETVEFLVPVRFLVDVEHTDTGMVLSGISLVTEDGDTVYELPDELVSIVEEHFVDNAEEFLDTDDREEEGWDALTFLGDEDGYEFLEEE